MARNLGCQKCCPCRKIDVGEFHEPIAGHHLSPFVVHDPPFGLTDVQLFEERAGRPELFLDRSLEFFRLPV
jgi:hypothetical protein